MLEFHYNVLLNNCCFRYFLTHTTMILCLARVYKCARNVY